MPCNKRYCLAILDAFMKPKWVCHYTVIRHSKRGTAYAAVQYCLVGAHSGFASTQLSTPKQGVMHPFPVSLRVAGTADHTLKSTELAKSPQNLHARADSLVTYSMRCPQFGESCPLRRHDMTHQGSPIACVIQAGGAPLDAATLRQLAEAVMSSAPQAGVQPVDLAQNLLQSNPSADALVRQLAQMQVQNQQVNYQQQVCILDYISFCMTRFVYCTSRHSCTSSLHGRS